MTESPLGDPAQPFQERPPPVEPLPPVVGPPPVKNKNGYNNSNGGNKAPYRLSQNVVNAVAVVVTVVWGISFIADILVPGYTPPTNVHMALMVVLGGVFGSQFVKRDG